MELLKVENLDLENNKISVVFDGILKGGFWIDTEFSYDEEQLEVEEEDTDCKNIIGATNINFWDFTITDCYEKVILINNRELKKIKQLVEFKLIDLLSDELNNN